MPWHWQQEVRAMLGVSVALRQDMARHCRVTKGSEAQPEQGDPGSEAPSRINVKQREPQREIHATPCEFCRVFTSPFCCLSVIICHQDWYVYIDHVWVNVPLGLRCFRWHRQDEGPKHREMIWEEQGHRIQKDRIYLAPGSICICEKLWKQGGTRIVTLVAGASLEARDHISIRFLGPWLLCCRWFAPSVISILK